MNSKFTDEQIRAYASQFRKGDAIWTNGKWCEVIEYGNVGRLATEDKETENEYVINSGEYDNFKGTTKGFSDKLKHNRYRVTTLEHYELQSGEKLVWLGKSDENRTFGEIYKVLVNNLGSVYYVGDSGLAYYISGTTGVGYSLIARDEWGVIPHYEQIKKAEKGTDETSEVKIVRASECTGVFKIDDEIKTIAVTAYESESIRYLCELTFVKLANKLLEEKQYDKAEKLLNYLHNSLKNNENQ